MTETQLKADIQKALDQLGIPRWRMQAGGYRGRTRGLPKGTPDILASPCVTIMGALFPCWLWIEVKLPKGKLSVEQVEFADKIKSAAITGCWLNRLMTFWRGLKNGRPTDDHFLLGMRSADPKRRSH